MKIVAVSNWVKQREKKSMEVACNIRVLSNQILDQSQIQLTTSELHQVT
jgi:hypothetical protein